MLLAFKDNTILQESINTLFRYTLLFGGLAMAALFFLAVWLAGRIVPPSKATLSKGSASPFTRWEKSICSLFGVTFSTRESSSNCVTSTPIRSFSYWILASHLFSPNFLAKSSAFVLTTAIGVFYFAGQCYPPRRRRERDPTNIESRAWVCESVCCQ